MAESDLCETYGPTQLKEWELSSLSLFTPLKDNGSSFQKQPLELSAKLNLNSQIILVQPKLSFCF